MLSRDWQGWHVIAVTAGVISGCATMITPEFLGISLVTSHWIIIIATIICGVSAAMGNSGLPGQKELTAMSVGKAVITPTIETKAAAVTAIDAIPIPTEVVK